jgi:hypothetical protein
MAGVGRIDDEFRDDEAKADRSGQWHHCIVRNRLDHDRLAFANCVDLDAAINEPFARLLTSHHSFNRSVKVSFGGLSLLSNQLASGDGVQAFALPTDSEPWGQTTRWRNLYSPVKDAAIFLADLGIARATTAFEDYATGAKDEFDRAGLSHAGAKKDGASALHGFDAVVGLTPRTSRTFSASRNFFDIARNCVVHRSNQASGQLAKLRVDPALEETLGRWPRRIGK